jgi:hypothetical protein
MNDINLNTNYYSSLSKHYPDLYISYNKVADQLKLVDEIDNKNTIPLKNTKDLLLLTNMIPELDFHNCTDFINYLSNYPMLGYKHEIGRKIFEYINSCPKEMIMNFVVYRVRKSTAQKQIQYTENEMFEPQYTYPKQNRFSMVGLNPLYLAEKLEVALKETGVLENDKYTWMKLRIKNQFKMLNVTNDQIPLFELCHKKTSQENSNLYIEYLIPNYISDCAKYCSFEGIIYNSAQSLDDKNYVLFNAGKRDFEIMEITGNNYEK